MLAVQKSRLEAVAFQLRVRPRTLHRRQLNAEITFHDLLGEALREMAIHYSFQLSLELNETAYLLGYERSNSFIRALHKGNRTSI
jgi:EAL domain-containing protein (putative c-di-GMP-specific phosphodiesterase class I)